MYINVLLQLSVFWFGEPLGARFWNFYTAKLEILFCLGNLIYTSVVNLSTTGEIWPMLGKTQWNLILN